ncbi:hypothetical protein [Bacillus sp. FJAT-49736]|uniref:hypothetical protein n=1 Tax=Bacillus sp. FJAT-49736 TaxID=2833582 RepID=UPI001BC92287|nr:hypothetical protein [Bacillus sp. FJAT-49736]MBS4172603.1 hypothetical protein [Bacillus sp. FJAT-49736]
MTKRILWRVYIAFLFLFFVHILEADASSQISYRDREHSQLNHEEFLKLERQGYKVQDIVRAAHISMYTNNSIESILRYYKKYSSWDKTAQHFGVDLKKLEANDTRNMQNSQQEYKEKMIKIIATYTKMSTANISQYLKEDADIHFLLIAAAISKTSNTELSQIIQYKKEDKNVDQIIHIVQADRKKVFEEVQMLHNRMKQIK